MRAGDFIAKEFPGTTQGLTDAITYAGSNGTITLYPGASSIAIPTVPSGVSIEVRDGGKIKKYAGSIEEYSRSGTRRNVFSVLDYGVNADGVTDDRTAINAAIAAAAGSELVFPKGTYAIGNKLSIAASGTTITLLPGAIIKAIAGFPGGTALLQVGDGTTVYSNITVRGPGKLDGNSLATYAVFSTGPNKNVRVLDVEATGCLFTTLNFIGVSAGNPAIGVLVRGCYVHDTMEGIQAVKATDVQFLGNRVEDMSQQDCLEVSEVTRFLIAGNFCKNPGNGNSAIDIFENSSEGEVVGNICSATGGTPAGAIGMDFNTTPCKRITLSKNIVTGLFATGMGCNGGSEILMEGNTIHDLTVQGGSPGKGMEIKANDITIRGNYIARTQSIPIHVPNAQDNVRIIDNDLIDPVLYSFGGNEFINIGNAGSTNIVIRGNRLRSTSGAARNPALSIVNAAGAGIICENNDMQGIVTGGRHIDLPNDAGLTARYNTGHITENNGTATIGAAATSVTVNHGLGKTPALEDISVTPTNATTNDIVRWWISGVGATQFTINVGGVPGASTATFGWTARIV